MREPIGPHQCSSVLISAHQRTSSSRATCNQCSSVLISAHQCSSVLISVRRPVARRLPRESRAVGPAWRGAHAPVGRGGRWRRGEHLHARGAGRGAHAPVISGHQRSWAVMGGHQRPSEVIRVHPRSSEVISGNHHPLGQPRDLHLPRGPPVHAGGLDAQGLTCGNSTRTQAHSDALRRTQAHRGTQGHRGTRVQSAGFSPQSVRHQSRTKAAALGRGEHLHARQAISMQSTHQSGGTRPRSGSRAHAISMQSTHQSGGTRPRSGSRAHGWAP
jgi:hypothetical protein